MRQAARQPTARNASASAAASRPARLGLIDEPGGPARNTGRFLMYREAGSDPPYVSSAWGRRQMSWSPTVLAFPSPMPTW